MPDDATPISDIDMQSSIADVVNASMDKPPVTTTVTPPETTPVVTSAVPPVVPPVETTVTQPVETPPESLVVPAELLQSTPVVKPDESTAKEFDVAAMNDIKIEHVDPKLRVNFAKIRDKLNGVLKEESAYTAKIAELEAQLAERPKAPEDLQKQWDAEKSELMDKIGKTDLAADPRFIAKYEQMEAPVANAIQGTIDSYNVEGLNSKEAIAFCKTLSAQDRAVWLQDKLPDEVAQVAMSTILPMFAQLDMIKYNRSAELENHTTTSASIAEQQEAATASQIMALREASKNEAMVSTAESEFLLKRVEGNDPWNKSVETLNANVNTIFASQDPKVHAKALVESQLMPVYKSMFLAEHGRREKLEAAIRARNITLPEINTTQKPPAGTRTRLSDISVDDAVSAVSANLM